MLSTCLSLSPARLHPGARIAHKSLVRAIVVQKRLRPALQKQDVPSPLRFADRTRSLAKFQWKGEEQSYHTNSGRKLSNVVTDPQNLHQRSKSTSFSTFRDVMELSTRLQENSSMSTVDMAKAFKGMSASRVANLTEHTTGVSLAAEAPRSLSVSKNSVQLNPPSFCVHGNKLPLDLSLKTSIRFTSTASFESSLLDEREFHKLSNELLHHLQEKFEELGEECDIDGFDIDYAEGVLTIKMGASGTYVINKQTPNRQIWLSSPVSGPARFDWDTKEHCWVYRRTKAEICRLLEKEVHDLVGASITLSK